MEDTKGPRWKQIHIEISEKRFSLIWSEVIPSGSQIMSKKLDQLALSPRWNGKFPPATKKISLVQTIYWNTLSSFHILENSVVLSILLFENKEISFHTRIQFRNCGSKFPQKPQPGYR